ncbi:MAG: hypothetical protein LIO53_03510 [Oscillospiraceae bacterium]|nr:hypothetical protein [Oscillospiraceae bacterium]
MNNSRYDDAIQGFADNFVLEETKKDFLENASLINIRKELKNKKTYNVLCRIKADMQETVGAKYEKFSFCFSDDDNQNIIMTTRDITDIIEWGQNLKS